MTTLSRPNLPRRSENKQFKKILLLALASLLLFAKAQHAVAQNPPGTILPVASIFLDGQWIHTYENDPYTANAAFFCDPVGSGYYPGGNSLINLPMTATVYSENMIPETVNTSQGSVQAVIGGNNSVYASVNGVNASCAGFVVTNNQIWLGVCCYCNRGPSSEEVRNGTWWEYYSLNHFQIRVEAAQWTAGAFLPYSDSTGAPVTWSVVTNAGLDVVYSPNGNLADVSPALSNVDNVLIYDPAADTVNITSPSAGPNCQFVNFVRPTWPRSQSSPLPSSPFGCLMLIPITLPPQPFNMLRVAVQAWDASTPADLDASGTPYSDSYVNDALGFFYPHSLDYNLPNGIGPAQDYCGYGLIFQGPNDFDSYTAESSSNPNPALSDYSPPFVVALKPVSLAAYDQFPIGIIYNIPGDKSSVMYTTGSSFMQSWGFSSQENEMVANAVGQSFNFTFTGSQLISSMLGASGGSDSGGGSGGGMSGPEGLTENLSYNSGSTATTTTSTMGQSQESMQLTTTMTFANGYNWSTPASNLKQVPESTISNIWQEPFWDDQIYVLPAPVVGSWSFPAVGGSPPSLQQQLLGFLGSQPPMSVEFLVKDLYCAYLNSAPCCDVTGTNLQIGPNEALALANLDPFFVARWQGEAPTNIFPNRFVLIKPFDNLPQQPQESDTWTVNQMGQVVVNLSTQSVDGVQYQQSSGVNITLGLFGVDGNPGSMNMGTSGTTLTLVNQASGSLQTIQNSTGTLEDDQGFAKGGNVSLFYDTWANSFCVQDAQETKPNDRILDWPSFCSGELLEHDYTVINGHVFFASEIDPNSPVNYLLQFPNFPIFPNPPAPPQARAFLPQASLPQITPGSPQLASAVLPQPPISLQPPIIPQSPTNFAQLNIPPPQIGP